MLHPREWAVELCKSYLVIWTGIDPTKFKTSEHKKSKMLRTWHR